MRGIARALGVAIALTPAGAGCQMSISVGASVLSDYVLRGVTNTNSTVIQPDLSIAHPFATGSLTFGAFANVEPAQRRGPNDLSQTGGVRSGLAEVDIWTEYAGDIGSVHATGGVLVYTYDHGNAAATSALNTTEVYGKFALPSVPLSPELHAYFDVQAIHGLYFEGQLSHSMPVAGHDVSFAALAGFAAGEEQQGASDALFLFAKSGLTHIDLSATTNITFGWFSTAPVLHVQYAPKGQNSRVVGAMASHQDQAARIWFGVRLGAAGTVGPVREKK